MSIRDAISLQPITHTMRSGDMILLTRPTLADVIDAIECNAKTPTLSNAHLMARHVREVDGSIVWESAQDALTMPASLAQELLPLVEALYREGQD